MPSEPLLFVSLRNKYILKCVDGIFVDGKSTGLSGHVHRSLYHRENWPGATQTSDMTWLTDDRTNPLAVGQYINNGVKDRFPSNVRYEEVDLPANFPRELRQYIPNMTWTSTDPFSQPTRVVALVTTRPVHNEELYSTYMDAV
ncbi:hypothetical protein BCR43DRAFT_488260 [Syncephalastrum racemosum]|uniref:Uncharacterized protein n=1 Tax=Syncephalastrum racemosum TaxID=13706 RepID=A0A1X2HIB4_SYNRA|nr:hypothetical protein BCR43DRAFT_488260 [Syncephalastrum racemosum]